MNTVTLNIADQPPQAINADHYQAVFEKEFPGPFNLVVRRCGHGSLIVHSRDANHVDRFLDASPPSAENLAKAIRHCLPEMTDDIAGDVMPGLVETILALPLPANTPLADDVVTKSLTKLFTELLLGPPLTALLLGPPPTPELTENVVLEVPNEQGDLEIRMSDRGPVVIAPAQWPILGEEFFGAEKIACVCIRIRQHAQDGRLLIYGENRRLGKPGEIHAGILLEGPFAKPDSITPGATVKRIAGELMGPGRDHDIMVTKLLAKLPSQRL